MVFIFELAHGKRIRIEVFVAINKKRHQYELLRKFENRRNNICLIPLLDACSFSRWCTFLKMFEIPAKILISSYCLLQPIKPPKI